MKKIALIKDILRDIGKSKGRYLSIVVIIALGVAFFFGLKMAPESMWLTADKYYDNYNLMDIRLVSSLGLTKKDLKEVEKINGVKDVLGTYSMDVLGRYDEKEIVLKIHGYSEKDNINKYKLVEGRMPEKSNEGLLEKGKNDLLEIPLGSKIELSSGKDNDLSEELKNTEYTIVGLVQSPYYLSSEKGNTNIGSGKIDSFIVIPEENFKMETYTDIFLTVEGAKKLNSYKDEYFDLVDPVREDLKILAKEREFIRYEDIIEEGSKEVEEGRGKYLEEKKKVEKELEVALNEIEDAREKIGKGEKELIDGRQKILDGEKEIKDGEREIEESIKELEAREKELIEGEVELKKREDQIQYGEDLLIGEEKQFNQMIEEGKREIRRAEEELEAGEKQYEEGLNQLKTEEESLKEIEIQIEKDEVELIVLEEEIKDLKIDLEDPELSEEDKSNRLKEVEKVETLLSEKTKEVKDEKIRLEASKERIVFGERILNEIKKIMDNSKSRLEGERQKILDGEAEGLREFGIERKKIEDGKRQLEIGRKELEDGKSKIEDGWRKIEEGKRELDLAKKEIEDAKIKLEEGPKEIEDARLALKDGEKEYEEGKKKAEKELKEALEEIEDGERKLRKIEKGKWYVLDRKKHYSYRDYGGAAERMDALAKVFPIFFVLVAALVCLTNMTRMVDEQRINIGTLKALGYGVWDIASKYVFYASTATILGCLIGLVIGYLLFPTIIFNAYGIMYVLPKVTLAFNAPLAISISLGALLITTGTTFIASSKELKESPSRLMRPKAPKIGKRIILERIPIIWDKFNFSYKVTIRNIFRYKRRFFMTVFGIAGCTALMLTAFGIRDSITTIVDKQYGSIFNYDISIGLEEGGTKHLDDNDEIRSYELMLKESGVLSLNDIEKEIFIIVPRNKDKVENFIRLEDRKTEKQIKIPSEGAIISEQISKEYDLDLGDEILLKNGENDEASIKISGITENYTFNYAYMSQEYYEDIFPEKVEYNEAIANIRDNSEESQEKLSKNLIDKEEINSVGFTSTLRDDFENTISSIIYVVILMIISAGALAFVVLYNLSNVNISERTREIATIKVLGFYDKEVSAYIYRENIILTFIGIGLGLIIGRYLHRFIMLTVEMDNIMFGLKIDFKSHIMAMILTIVFSILVNIVMHFKLREIEMVESLKSVD